MNPGSFEALEIIIFLIPVSTIGFAIRPCVGGPLNMQHSLPFYSEYILCIHQVENPVVSIPNGSPFSCAFGPPEARPNLGLASCHPQFFLRAAYTCQTAK
jgi:hypothetical protein